MASRLLIALLGALVITTTLLLGMDYVTTILREHSGPRMYRISDVIMRDRSGRPDMPEPPTPLPALPDTSREPAVDPGIVGQAPSAPAPSLLAPPVVLETVPKD